MCYIPVSYTHLHADEDADVRIGHDVGQKRQTNHSRQRERVRRDHRGSVSDFIDKLCGNQIDKQLQHEVQGDEQGDFFQRNAVRRLKG